MSLPVRGFDAFRTADGLTSRNKLGIADDPERLEAAENALVRNAYAELGQSGISRTFDPDHLRAIHRHLFADVYEWAGIMRGEPITLDGETFLLAETMQKSGSPVRFASASTVEARLGGLFARLEADDYLQGLDRTDFARKAGAFFAELNEIHPFPEGNGRTQRVLVQQLAEGAGHSVDFSVVSAERMAAISEQAIDTPRRPGSPAGIIRMMDEISDPVRTAPLRTALTHLDQNAFQWQETYISTTVPGERYKGTFVGHAGDSFMMMVGTSSIAVGFTADLDQVPKPGAPIHFMASERGYNHALAVSFDRLDRADAERHPTLAAAHRASDRLEAEVAREFRPHEEAFDLARQHGLQTIRQNLREGRAHSADLGSHAVETVRGHDTGLSH